MTATKAWIRAIEYSRDAVDKTLPGMIHQLGARYGDKPAMLSEDVVLSYTALAAEMDGYARWALAYGFRNGDVVCLMMANHPTYVALWLGLSRIGCTVALLNTNLSGDALVHCIRAAGADTVIVDGAVPPIEQPFNWITIAAIDTRQDYSVSTSTISMPQPDDRALLIYTSGTTGWPKAAVITHRRIVEWSHWFAGMMNVSAEDCLYNCLPMYHSIGGIVAIGSMLVMGGCVLIRERFSASRFWDDVADRRCTIFFYIGELCRYLTLLEKQPQERSHRLRLACGNGLQGDVWTVFQERFGIPRILEFYAATEGNLSLYNVEGKPGSIGRIPPFLARHFAVAILRCDPETGVIARDENGFCIPCANAEPGEAISRMGRGRQFDGYTDPDASERKVLHDVFAKGDRWFRSGDLMRRDDAGYYYFVDRLGDTFRWKGENVSTTEVASVLRGCPGVNDAVVYGVHIPGNEGRAGMAAICIDDRFNFALLAAHLKVSLPAYAHPVFVRLCASLDMTGTFKLSKTDLVRDSYSDLSDRLWKRDNQSGEYRQVVNERIVTANEALKAW